MDLNLIILGSLLILTIFGVGESVYKKFKINRIFVIICLGLLLLGLYVPNLKIKDISLNISGFILPTALAIFFAFKIRSAWFFINLLIVTFTMLIVRLVYIDVEFVPILAQFLVMGSLGVILALLTKDAYSIIVASVTGYFVGNTIFELIKFNSVINLLSANAISLVLIALITALLTLFVKLKLKSKLTLKKSQNTAVYKFTNTSN